MYDICKPYRCLSHMWLTGGSRPVTSWKSVWEHPHAMLWLHAYGRSVGSVLVRWPRDRNISNAYPKGFCKVHVQATYGSLWIFTRTWETRTIMYAGTMQARGDVIYGLGNIRMISRVGSMRPVTEPFMLYLPGKTWLCAIWPVGANTVPARRPTCLLTSIKLQKGRVWKLCRLNFQPPVMRPPYGSKHLRNETYGWSPALSTWGDVSVSGPWKVRTKSHYCNAVVTCVILVISALWPHENVKTNVYPTGSVRCPFGYSTSPCRCRAV